MILEFGDCVLDTSKQELWRDDRQVHLEPQVLAVLEYLVSHRERVVTKIELLDEVWGDRFVSESALTSRIKLARKACGDTGRDQRIVRTIHSRGYRFVAPVTHRDAPGTPASTGPAVRDAVGASTSVFGRSAELAMLDDALSSADAGRRQAVFVRGRSGCGKSTLVAEFLERQDGLDGWHLVRGQCIQARGGVEPYFCLLDALGRVARNDPSVVATLDRVAPSWLAQLPSLLDHETAERLERRLLGTSPARMLREGVDAFEAMAQSRPVVMVLEDLHWADDCTLDVLDVLLQRIDPLRLLLIGTARDEPADLDAVVDAAVAGGRAANIMLGPLDRHALQQLADDRLDISSCPDAVIDAVVRRCEGVPLFAEEILASWLRNGQITVENGRVQISSSAAELVATVPPSLPPLVERELATLEIDEIDMLEVCAVAGDVFDAATVALASDQAVDQAERMLAELARRRGMIGATGASSWPDGTISAEYAFTHQLVRQVIYDRTSFARRAALHERIGRILEAGYGAHAAELATRLADHFLGAGDMLRAAEHLRAAGERSYARDAHAHAIDFFTLALERVGAVPPSTERDAAERRIRIALGPALVATKGWIDSSVAENYERALALCADDTTGPDAAAARYGLATISELQGRFERTETLLTPLLAAEGPGYFALEAHELVACSTFHQGAFDRSLENSQAVLESWDEDAYSVFMARIAEHPAASCSSWSSLALWAVGRSDESLRLAERAVVLGEQNRYALSTAVQQRAMLHQLRHELEDCIEWSDRCRQIGEEQDFQMRMIQADIYKGWALGVRGEVDEGLSLIEDGLERFRAAGASLNEAYYLGLDADVLLHGDQPDRAMERLTTARQRTTSRTYFYDPELRRLAATAHLTLGGADAVDRARAALDEARELATRRGAVALELRILVDRCALEFDHGDPTPWSGALQHVAAVYRDQQPTPDTIRAAELLAR